MGLRRLLFAALLCSLVWVAGSASLAAAAAADEITHRAKVVSAIASAGYSYIEVEEAGTTFWISTMETVVAAGDTVEFPDMPRMENFTSKSLNRHFDRIMFVPGITKSASAGANIPIPVSAAAEKMAPGRASAGADPSTAAALAEPQAAKLYQPGHPTLHRGVVKARLEGGGLIFLEVQEGAGRQWIAVTSTKARPGDPVQFGDSPPVAPFTSAALGKTFSSVAFPEKVTVVSKSRPTKKQE